MIRQVAPFGAARARMHDRDQRRSTVAASTRARVTRAAVAAVALAVAVGGEASVGKALSDGGRQRFVAEQTGYDRSSDPLTVSRSVHRPALIADVPQRRILSGLPGRLAPDGAGVDVGYAESIACNRMPVDAGLDLRLTEQRLGSDVDRSRNLFQDPGDLVRQALQAICLGTVDFHAQFSFKAGNGFVNVILDILAEKEVCAGYVSA